jgi:hypothetical protein
MPDPLIRMNNTAIVLMQRGANLEAVDLLLCALDHMKTFLGPTENPLASTICAGDDLFSGGTVVAVMLGNDSTDPTSAGKYQPRNLLEIARSEATHDIADFFFEYVFLFHPAFTAQNRSPKTQGITAAFLLYNTGVAYQRNGVCTETSKFFENALTLYSKASTLIEEFDGTFASSLSQALYVLALALHINIASIHFRFFNQVELDKALAQFHSKFCLISRNDMQDETYKFFATSSWFYSVFTLRRPAAAA